MAKNSSAWPVGKLVKRQQTAFKCCWLQQQDMVVCHALSSLIILELALLTSVGAVQDQACASNFFKAFTGISNGLLDIINLTTSMHFSSYWAQTTWILHTQKSKKKEKHTTPLQTALSSKLFKHLKNFYFKYSAKWFEVV